MGTVFLCIFITVDVSHGSLHVMVNNEFAFINILLRSLKFYFTNLQKKMFSHSFLNNGKNLHLNKKTIMKRCYLIRCYPVFLLWFAYTTCICQIDAKLAKLFVGYLAGSKSTQEGKEENGKKFHDYSGM